MRSARVHDRDYVEEVLAAHPVQGLCAFDADTSVSPGRVTRSSARRAP
jgi:hypothetical protein